MNNSNITSNAASDVLILCALREEYLEVLNVVEDIIGTGWQSGNTPEGWEFSEAEFKSADSLPLRVVVSYCAFMGREQASATLAHLWNRKPAQCIAMSGICAGRRNKVALGDVVFADRLYSYDAGKVTTQGNSTKFQADPVQTGPTPMLVQRMHAVSAMPPGDWILKRPKLTLEEQEDWALACLKKGETPHKHANQAEFCPDWAQVFKRLIVKGWISKAGVISSSGLDRANYLDLAYAGHPEPQLGFRVHVAPMATGAAVVEDAEIFSRLSDSMRKVLALDMEGSALGAAAQFMNVPVVISKGVSDYGDILKDDRVRGFAARASAEYLIRLLRHSADLFRISANSPLKNIKNNNASPSPVESGIVPRDLIEFLADEYPDVGDARALWVRAGGRAGQIPTTTRSFDLWQRLWAQSVNGASARPCSILEQALHDFPDNAVVQRYLSLYPV